MNIGIIGLGETGSEILLRLLRRTCHDIWAYDPDGRACDIENDTVHTCTTAACICDACRILFVALESTAEQRALINGVFPFLREGTAIVDLTDCSPVQAHKNANALRRLGVGYLDCGIVSRNGCLSDPFLFLIGGDGALFSSLYTLLRCVAPDCRYMGPSGRGRAVRLICLALCARLQQQVEEAALLADSFGIRREAFFDALDPLPQIADPLAALHCRWPLLDSTELAKAEQLVAEMERRAGLRDKEKQIE